MPDARDEDRFTWLAMSTGAVALCALLAELGAGVLVAAGVLPSWSRYLVGTLAAVIAGVVVFRRYKRRGGAR